MQEQTLFREKYNFAKFEWRRIRSLWGLLGKDKTAQNDEDITMWQMLKRIFAEIRGAAWRPFVKVIVLTVVCPVLGLIRKCYIWAGCRGFYPARPMRL